MRLKIAPNQIPRHKVLRLYRHQDRSIQKSQNRFGQQSQNLGSIIRGFKIGVTKQARIIRPDFQWQPRFHDHIIRDEESFNGISEYIQNNPSNWKKDTFYPKS